MFQGQFNIETSAPVEAAANADVLFELAMLYASGRDGQVDLVAAHKWFNLAALKGRVDALQFRREVAESMSDDEIAKAQREARAWMAAN
jgi:TPR repeat protein